MRPQKKRVLFERGAQAVERLYGVRSIYYCPICRDAYPPAALLNKDLTLEHVPPASVGGKGIALTCRSCNSTAGHTVDAAVSQRAELMRFAELIVGRTGHYAGRAILEIRGEKVNMEVSRSEDNVVSFNIPERSNDPQTVKRVHEIGPPGSGESIRVTSRVCYHPRLSQIGDLRSAYLAAFAAFGYSYAFHPHLSSVREQIRRPNERIIDGWTLRLAEEKDMPLYLLLVTSDPVAVMVKLRETGVFLPLPGGPSELYDQLRIRHAHHSRVHLTGRCVRWPTTLEMACDFFDRPSR